VRSGLGHDLAGAGTALAGLGAAAGAYMVVGGLPGTLYAAGITLAALVAAVAILARRWRASAASGAQPAWWRRKSQVIVDLELELATTRGELEEHRRALAHLGAQLTREAEAAERTRQGLETRIAELEAEREQFQQRLDSVTGGIGRHGSELAQLEQEIEALVSR
jgi:FtsZ-binding cell division protein ZapB